jgi:hypothetical protein
MNRIIRTTIAALALTLPATPPQMKLTVRTLQI